MEYNVADAGGSSSSDRTFQVAIEPGLTGIRLDQFLSQSLPSASRSLVASSIRRGLVFVDTVCRKSSYRLKAGEIVSGSIKLREETDVQPERIDFQVLYEDQYLLLLVKPPGLVVHPGSGNYRGTLANGLVHYCHSIAEVGDGLRPGIVHRLDKDTSGIMLVAKQGFVHQKLVELFKHHQLDKEYLALVHGVLKEKKGRVVAAIGRHPINRQKMAVRPGDGRHAATNWQVLQEFCGQYSLLKIAIETGRTHQIRVHMAHLGFPVAGDRVYGGHRDNTLFPRQMLHASRLVLHHPVTDQVLDYTARPWPDFTDVLQNLGGQPEMEVGW
jgi:23S rRNA pseudouridine1911/1915/1917 synthase